MLDIDTAQLIAFLIGTILPLITGLVTRWNASAGVRAVVLLVLAGLTSFLTELLSSLNANVPFDLGDTLLATLTTFLIGVGTHFGLWKPTGAAGAAKSSGGFIGGSKRSARRDAGTVTP